MSLNSAQLATLKADINLNADTKDQPMTSAGNDAIRSLYNAVSTQDVWQTSAPVQSVYDAIDWSKFTPVDAADATVTYTNRLMLIQTKQMNLQSMLQGRTTVDASKANLRAGLRDAVIALPAGISGVPISAGGSGGATVLNALMRKATRFEKLFATTPAVTGPSTANLLVVEGNLSIDDIQIARES